MDWDLLCESTALKESVFVLSHEVDAGNSQLQPSTGRGTHTDVAEARAQWRVAGRDVAKKKFPGLPQCLTAAEDETPALPAQSCSQQVSSPGFASPSGGGVSAAQDSLQRLTTKLSNAPLARPLTLLS